MKKILISLYFLTVTAGFAASAQNIQAAIEAISADPVFSQAIVGICARTEDGQVIAEVNPGKMMVPASNMKLISTGAALHAFGPDYQFETSIAHDGYIDNGTLYGNLYIIGEGDPTTGSKDSIAVATERTFAEWEAIIKASGIRKIEGYIIGDGRSYEGMAEEPTWLWNDIGTYYGAGVTGLMFYENMLSFSVSAGEKPGAPVNIKPHYPETPWMLIRHNCATGKEGTGDQLYMYTSDLAPVAEIRGTFGVDKGAKRVDCANKFPEYTCASYFHKWLKKKGIDASKGPADFRMTEDSTTAMFSEQSELEMLGSTFSPSLERIIFETNHASNNLYAETLMRTLGKEMRGSASYDSSYVALNDVLRAMKVDASKGAKIQDGSGLSRQNYISPDFFCRFLDAMMDSEHFGIYLNSLPFPGGNGTMQYNMKGQQPGLRNRIRVKSGSMNGVRCYSGYILPSGYIAGSSDYENLPEEVKSKTIVFSIMTNNCTSPTWKVRPLLDKIMVTLAGAN